jgi:formamidopyrimidine-DNA glycosylase
MPELPEVETTRRSLAPHLEGRVLRRLVVRERRLRWPVEKGLEARLAGARILAVQRRAKYLLIGTERGWMIVHLGMSGSLQVLPAGVAPRLHDHFDLELDDGTVVRYHDPRRFGSLHFSADDPNRHALLAAAAPEPLDDAFDGAYLHSVTQGRRVAIKQLLLNGRLVTGVGNIYASEALHRAAIHPATPARRLSAARCERLAAAVKQTLAGAIAAGGSSLRDYVNGAGEPGWAQMDHAVYEREGKPCPRCGTAVRRLVQGQRASYFCPGCQRG